MKEGLEGELTKEPESKAVSQSHTAGEWQSCENTGFSVATAGWNPKANGSEPHGTRHPAWHMKGTPRMLAVTVTVTITIISATPRC